MLIFLLFSVLNLAVGFAAAVLLGYGPQPWYALFLPSKQDNVIQIEAIDSEEEAETEKSVAATPPAQTAPNFVNQPFPEMNEQAETSAPLEPEAKQATEPVAEAENEPVAESHNDQEEDSELEEYLAGRKEETKKFEEEEPASEEPAEIASADDIESMFAATQTSGDKLSPAEEPDAEAEPSEEDDSLNQDDIAALFNS